MAGRTIVDVFAHIAARHPDRPALHWREGKAWRSSTWSEYREAVLEVATALRRRGVSPGDFVAIQAANRPEHVIADLAVVHAGATPVTVYGTFSPNQIAHVIGDCGARVAFLENADALARWEEAGVELDVILIDGDGSGVTAWDDLRADGRRREGVDEAIALDPDGLATLIYTSGTTGSPKGVMINHRNVMWTVESVRRLIRLDPHPRLVSYLPLAHIAERAASHYLGIYLAGEVWMCPDMGEVIDYVQAARPHLFVGVPRVWEKVSIRLAQRFEDMTGLRRRLLDRAVELGKRKVQAEQSGRRLGIVDSITHRLLDRLVLAKVRDQLGMDSVVYAITTAAPISPDSIVFFQALGLPLFELYGMSENTGPATSNVPEANRIGSVGRPLPGVEVKIDDDSEILLRGGIVAPGYFGLPTETADTFGADGWLHTGDLGRVDEDGFLHVIGRKKDILITAAGKNVAPARIETALADHPLIGKAAMVGDGRKFLSVLVSLDPEEAPTWAARRGIEYQDLGQLSRLPEVEAEVTAAIENANRLVSRVEQVKRHLIVPDAWSPETGELTPSMKLRRWVVLERYAAEIERMYAD